MPADTSTKNNENKISAPGRKLWTYIACVVLVVIAFAYLQFTSSRDGFANQNFYRVLYEATSTFNENLNKLDRMLESGQSASAISSVLPSYSVEPSSSAQTNINQEDQNGGTRTYTLNGKRLAILTSSMEARVNLEQDILPSPKYGFSSYIFADREGNVLATIGGEKTISVVDLKSISSEIQAKQQRFLFSLKEQKGTADTQNRILLPGSSSHADITLSYGAYRVFIFPFLLDTEIGISSKDTGDTDSASTTNKIYLVGLLPKKNISASYSYRWNASLLLATVVSLFFLWTLLRLYLLPTNQPITPIFRNITLVSSYGFYLVIVALLLSFMLKSILQSNKDNLAFTYAKGIQNSLREDVNRVFDQLSTYQSFYNNLLLIGENRAYPSTIEHAIEALASDPCEQNLDGKLPNYAWTGEEKYPITWKCDEGKMRANIEKQERQQVDFFKGAKEYPEGRRRISLVAGNLEVHSNPIIASYIKEGKNSYLPNNILSVFALDRKGSTVLPTITYQETNFTPRVVSLSHRDYYKKVIDHQGWRFCVDVETDSPQNCHNNIYIQRLLNVNDGTRGTTISLPFRSIDKDLPEEKKELAYILGADVILPSVSLAEPAPYDFSYMIVDRNKGDVLFHSDESRTLVENLFFSGNSNADLSQWIKGGLDYYPGISNKIIKGNYHGRSGRFLLMPSPIDAWAIVIFYPSNSLHDFMTNNFLFIVLGFSFFMLIIVAVLQACNYFLFVDAAKKRLCIPAKINSRMIIMVGSLILSLTYGLYNIGFVLDLKTHNLWPLSISLILPSTGLLLLLYHLYRKCRTKFLLPHANTIAKGKGLKRLFFVAISVSALHLAYLHFASQGALQGLAFQYQLHHCNWLNFERREINKMGLNRFPNSMTKQRMEAPYIFLSNAATPALDDKMQIYRDRLLTRRGCENHSPQVAPEDVIDISTQSRSTHLWHWINSYLLKVQQPLFQAQIQQFVKGVSLWPLLGYGLVLLCLALLWSHFNYRILWMRLYCSDRFLQNVKRLAVADASQSDNQPNPKLTIICNDTKLNGIGLSLLLRSVSADQTSTGTDMADKLLPGFANLFTLSPCLRKFSTNSSVLPNLKLCLGEDNNRNKALDVQLWDIETSLEKAVFRQDLLDLIMELKSLTLAGQLNSLTIFTGFHSFQRVKMKDSLSTEGSSVLEHAEYLSWAECLMDFTVKVPEIFEKCLDVDFLNQEIKDFPTLSCISRRPRAKCDTEQDDGKLLRQHEEEDVDNKWATMNYILLHAEALYRFKWESCSNSEKLALYNLSKGQSLNPSNTQMIAHLALNGLIKVNDNELEIVNKSFAHFVRNAETPDTLNELVSRGEAGVWRNYRIPLGFLIVLIIVGIALTSGESIYIIAASAAGVLGTILSVTNSASLLRGRIKD